MGTTRDMEFNPGKCVVMRVTWAGYPINSRYTMHYQILATVGTVRYLGVDLYFNLNFNTYISRITSNANKTLGFLKRNIRTKHSGVREAAYQTLLRPLVEYESAVWSPYTKQGIHKVEMVQRRAIRWTMNNYTHHAKVTDMQEKLGWRSLEQSRADARMIIKYKIIHGYVAILPAAYSNDSS